MHLSCEVVCAAQQLLRGGSSGDGERDSGDDNKGDDDDDDDDDDDGNGEETEEGETQSDDGAGGGIAKLQAALSRQSQASLLSVVASLLACLPGLTPRSFSALKNVLRKQAGKGPSITKDHA